MLVFVERGKPEYPNKKFRSKGDNQQQTQPTYGVISGIWTHIGGGECSHYFTTSRLAPRFSLYFLIILRNLTKTFNGDFCPWMEAKWVVNGLTDSVGAFSSDIRGLSDDHDRYKSNKSNRF